MQSSLIVDTLHHDLLSKKWSKSSGNFTIIHLENSFSWGGCLGCDLLNNDQHIDSPVTSRIPIQSYCKNFPSLIIVMLGLLTLGSNFVQFANDPFINWISHNHLHQISARIAPAFHRTSWFFRLYFNIPNCVKSWETNQSWVDWIFDGSKFQNVNV